MELFYQIVRMRNLELIIKNAELFVDEPADILLTRIYELYCEATNGGVSFQPFEVYGEMFAPLWEDLKSKVIKQVESFNVDISTRRHFAWQWIYNNIMNAKRLSESSNADGLVGAFSGVPGILVSAGPSLAKNAYLLSKLKHNCVIMAGGTAVNKLEQFGITPHFMVGIDAGATEAEVHRKVKAKDIFFVYSNQVSADSLESYKGPKFFMNYSVDLYSNEFLKFEGIKSHMFLSGPSVANTCFDLLYKMGCNPIIIIGQDLAFTGGSLYAGDEPDTSVKKDGYILTKDIYHKDIYSSAPMISMKNWFEGYFEKLKDKVEIINATEGGLNLEYARNEKLTNIISKLCQNDGQIFEKINQIYFANKFSEDISSKVNGYMEHIHSEIEEVENYSKHQLTLAELIDSGVCHPLKNRKKYESTISKITSLSDNIINSHIFDTILGGLIGVDFFLIKAEVERVVAENENYEDLKRIYIDAIKQQNILLCEVTERVKGIIGLSKSIS